MEHHISEEQAKKNFIAFRRQQKRALKAARPKVVREKLVKDPFALVHRLPFHSLIALNAARNVYLSGK